MISAQPGPGQTLMESPFAVLVQRGLSLFKSLVAGLDHDNTRRSMAVSHAAKFKLWAGSLGAHRSSGSRSLEYRLRDASFIRNHVLSLLQDLCESLNEAVLLATDGEAPAVSGDAPDATLDELAEYFQDGEEEQENELDAAMKSIGHEISCLLRLSVTIRNPAPHDQFKARASVEIVQHFKHWDTQHIVAKFPNAESHVQEQLAEATSRRRQYFKYREEHTARLADGLDQDAAALTLADPVERATTLASSLPDHLKRFRGPTELLMSDSISESSGTSYATSVSSSHQLRVPPLPEEHKDGPIKCPFCHMFIQVRNRSDWKRHVFRDLQPYICLRDDCSIPQYLYSRRTHWMQHMKAEHWKAWHCLFGCPGSFQSKNEWQAHLHSKHEREVSVTKITSLESLSSRADAGKPREKCPLCAEFWCGSVKQYEQHVGRHLEDLALFALPPAGGDEGSDEGSDEGNDEGSDESEDEENSRAVDDIDSLAAMAKSSSSAKHVNELLQAGVKETSNLESQNHDQIQDWDGSDITQDSFSESEFSLDFDDNVFTNAKITDTFTI